MTVRELIEELKLCDPKKQVMISSDAEGNSIKNMKLVDVMKEYPDVIIWPV